MKGQRRHSSVLAVQAPVVLLVADLDAPAAVQQALQVLLGRALQTQRDSASSSPIYFSPTSIPPGHPQGCASFLLPVAHPPPQALHRRWELPLPHVVIPPPLVLVPNVAGG